MLRFVLGSFLLIYSSASLLIATFPGPRGDLERLSCRFGICRNELLLEAAYRDLWEGGAEAVSRAVESFREALRRDSASPERWCDLGEALVEAGQSDRAAYCFSRAAELGPNSPPILLRNANYHFRTDQPRNAFGFTARILHSFADYDGAVFGTYDRMGIDLSEILSKGIPADRRAAQSYFRHLLRTGNVPKAEQGWQWITAQHFADDELAGGFLEFLVAKGRFATAAKAWAHYVGPRRNGYLESNYLYNGDFEFESTGAIFDWRITESDQVQVTRDSQVAHSGTWSLRLQFNAKENLAYSHVSQRLFVPAGRYRFEAYVRTEGITTDEGIGFRVFDPERLHLLDIRTDNMVGTSDWKHVTTTFIVSGQTALIELQVTRRPSLRFDSKIGGTAWIDSLKFAPVS